MLAQLAAAGRELARGFLQLLYPAICGVCGQSLTQEQTNFCPSCRLALVTDPQPSCPRCAATVGLHVNLDGGCSRCRVSRFHFDAAFRLGPYEGLLRQVVLRLKHHSGEGLAELLGELWAEQAATRFREIGPAVVVPVPLHWWRRWRRGYNQSEAIARMLAVRLRLPCRPGCLRRIRNTPQQTMQTPSGRRDNVRGAFVARSGIRVQGRTILLVDDVLTTGTTCSEAARALRAAGAARVIVAVLAHSQG